MALLALDIALELPALLRPLMGRVRAEDGGLADQVRRAANAVALQALEASGRTGRDRANRFRTALGEAKELVGGLRLAVGWGYLAEGEVTPVVARVDRLCGLLYGLSRQ